MNLSAIRIILVETSHPGNVGASARAMKTMGLEQLYLVNPTPCTDGKAYAMAASAKDVLASAKVTDTLAEALSGCQLVIAASARPRGLALKGLLPRECAELVGQMDDNTTVALVFGRESSGLTNEELLQCHYHVMIPANPEYSSLNLSQAVQVLAYELRMALLSPKAAVGEAQDRLATVDEVEGFYTHLIKVMKDIQFLKPNNPARLVERVRRLFNRVGLEQLEVNILRGLLTQFQKKLDNQ